MKILVIPVTDYEQNCSLIWCEETRQAALVDPGGEADMLLEAVAERELQLTKLFLTHGHLDHVGAAGELAESLGIPVEGPHRGDDFMLAALPQQSILFGFSHCDPFTPSRWLEDGDQVSFGNVTLEVIHCPGHTPGHVVYFHRESRIAFVGDVLFRGSIGRTDYPWGDHAGLLRGIRERLFTLGDDVTFIPGHGPSSTFGEERRSNPYVGG